MSSNRTAIGLAIGVLALAGEVRAESGAIGTAAPVRTPAVSAAADPIDLWSAWWSTSSLRMRRRVARAALPDSQPVTTDRVEPDASAPDDPTAAETRDADQSPTELVVTPPTDPESELGPRRRLSDKVIFRFNLGFGLDGGQRNCTKDETTGDQVCEPMASGAELDQHESYASLRSYGFGDVVIGTRGLGAASLASYFAASFRFDQRTGRLSSAVPSIHDANGVDEVLIRSGYAEADHVFEDKVLAPLYLRAGRQFRYGPAVAQFDGVTIGYDTRPFSVGAYLGSRVSMYGFPTGSYFDRKGLISGVDARFDMYEIKRVPLVLSGSMLSFDDQGHFEGELAYRYNPDVLVRASMRVRGSGFARQRFNLRARISSVTTINAEVEHRGSNDWAYDLLVADPEYGPTDARRYLNMGVPLPRYYLNLRAGTVLLDNIDLLLRAAAAIDGSDPLVDQPSSFSASYLEGGAGLEVRARRAIALGASFLTRRYHREPWESYIDQSGDPEPLPTGTGTLGERSFSEGGVSVRFSQGRHTFGAAAELYGRMYLDQSPYIDPVDQKRDLRGGGRFQVDGWANQRMHLRVEYDVAYVPSDLAPEIRGIKSLRVIAEGMF